MIHTSRRAPASPFSLGPTEPHKTLAPAEILAWAAAGDQRQLHFLAVLPQEDILPKRGCRPADQFVCEEIEAEDNRRFPRLFWLPEARIEI
jgi:hypothetical protein